MANYSIWILLVCVALLCLGHGLHGSLVGVRASAEDFGPGVTGFARFIIVSSLLSLALVPLILLPSEAPARSK
jgi:hypothetical protein